MLQTLQDQAGVTVCIKYGFGEGNWHGKRMVAGLERAGYGITRDAIKADVIISHSGGCFFLPVDNGKQLVLLIGPPYWPGKPLAYSMLQKVYRDIKDFIRRGQTGRWLVKTIWNVIYGSRYIAMTLIISWSARKNNFYQALRQDHIVLIRNDDDAFCTPDIDKLPVPMDQFTYYHLPGQHDDCWEHPEPYIQILQAVLAGRHDELRSVITS